MFHVKLFLVGKVIVNATLTKNRVNTVMLSKENISELLFSFKLFVLFCLNFLAVLVDEAVWDENKFRIKIVNLLNAARHGNERVTQS